MTTLTKEEYRALCRQDFHTFLMRSYRELHGRTRFRDNWHLEVISAAFQDCLEGRTKRLIINVPPRYLKSFGASIVLPAFWLGHRPSDSIINLTYGQNLSDKFARDCRTLMTCPWYRGLYATRLINPRASLQELITTDGGSRFATSVGGVLTGRGADLIIIDDPSKPDEVVSDAPRKAVNEFYDMTLFSRLNDKQAGVIILIMQRVHEDDLVGHLIAQGGWKVLSFPAIAEVDEEHTIETVFGKKTFRRKAGEALHPAWESTETLKTIQATIGSYNLRVNTSNRRPRPAAGWSAKNGSSATILRRLI